MFGDLKTCCEIILRQHRKESLWSTRCDWDKKYHHLYWFRRTLFEISWISLNPSQIQRLALDSCFTTYSTTWPLRGPRLHSAQVVYKLVMWSSTIHSPGKTIFHLMIILTFLSPSCQLIEWQVELSISNMVTHCFLFRALFFPENWFPKVAWAKSSVYLS